MRKIARILFSRLGVAAAVIFFEMVMVLILMLRLSAFSPYFLLLLVINYFASLIAVVNGDGNPEYKLTWMGVIVLIPFLGTVMYMMFGKCKMSKREIDRLNAIRDRSRVLSDSVALTSLSACDKSAVGKARAILGIDEISEVYSRTVSKYYGDGGDMFREMLEDLNGAEKCIYLEYFIISDGCMWRTLFDVLEKKAGCGIDVRVMYDDIGCMNILPKGFDNDLETVKIKHLCFSRISADLRNMRRNNNRDHRKLCIIDEKIAYTGGINIADEYIGAKKRFGAWKDGGVRLFGDAATGTARLFRELWMLSGGAECPVPEKHVADGDGGYYLPFGSGPYPMYRNQAGKRAILDIINQAQTYIYIMTPYLIVDYDLSEALRGAAFRGVNVKIITPGIPDKRMVKVMTKSSYHYLMEGGVDIYEYSPGFLHAKLVISDDLYGIVGTINMDYRSLVHHFEDAVWMYASPSVTDMRRDFLETMHVSERIDMKRAELKLREKLLRCVVKLFAPLL